MAFKGFTKKAVKYLHDVYHNNSKVWYAAHKKDFETYLKEPFYELISALTPQMRKIDPEFITEPKRCLAHIYRDVRYSPDGTLYRNRLWLTFKRPSENSLEIPAFFFELTENDCSYGMGYYTVRPSEMADIRDYIAQNPRSFKAAIAEIEKDPTLEILGDRYKKAKPGAPEGLEEWFFFKNFYVGATLPLEASMSPELLKTISEGFDKIAELYRVLTVEVPEMREDRFNGLY